MAAMTPEQITAELTRKAASGVTKASSAANQAQLDGIIKSRTDAANINTPTTVTAAPPTQPTFQSTYTGPDIAGMEGKLNSAIELRKTAELDTIRRERETALQGLNKVETQTKQQAYDNRNSADATNLQNAQRLRETMANMGILNSGENITATAGLNAQRQGALGAINRDESNTLTDIGERRSLFNNQAAGAERSLVANLEAERLRNSVDFMKYGDTASREQDQINYGRYRDGVGDTRYADETVYNRGRDTRNDFVTDRGFNRGVLESDRGFNRGVLESDRGFNRGVLESDRGFNRGVLESDRGFDRGVLESDRGYNLDVTRESRLSAGGGQTPPSADDSETRLFFDNMVQRDANGKITNQSAVENSILNSELSDYDVYRMYLRYEFPWNGPVPTRPNQ